MLKFYLTAKDRIDSAMKRLVKKEEGASLVEYGLLVGLIACVCIAAITLLGTNINDLLTRVAGKLTNVAP